MLCHIVVAPRVAINGIYPDFVVATVILIGIKRGWQNGLWFGFVFGITLDLFNPINLGWIILITSITGLLSGVIREKIYVESGLYQSAILAAITFIYKIVITFIETPGFFLENIQSSIINSLLTAVYTAMFAGIVLILLKQRYRLKELV